MLFNVVQVTGEAQKGALILSNAMKESICSPIQAL